MNIIEQIKADREAGTANYHWIGKTLMAEEFGEVVELFNADWSSLDEFEAEHKRRIARVPELEAIALAAEDLALAVAFWMSADEPDVSDAIYRLKNTLAAYRAATGAA